MREPILTEKWPLSRLNYACHRGAAIARGLIVAVMDRKKLIGFVGAMALLAVFYFVPVPDGLTQEAKMAVGLMFVGLVLWMSECMPTGVAALLIMVLMPYFGIFSFSELWSKFTSSAFFFVMGSFALSAALQRTSIPARANAMLLRRLGANTKGVIFGFMTISAVLSMMCANIATVAMMMGFTTALLKANKCVPKKSNFAKCMVLGVVYGSMIGGCATLSGSSSHIMLLSITEGTYNFSLSFVDWLIVSVPLVLILQPLTWWSLIKIFPPEPLSQEAVDRMIAEADNEGRMPRRDIAFGVFLLVVFSCWILSTWVPWLNYTAVSLLAVAFMFIPGVNFLDAKGFFEGVSWNTLLVVGSVIALTAGIAETGGMNWFVSQIAPLFENSNHLLVYLFATVFVCVVHCIVPSGSATAGVAALPLMELAKITGANPTTVFHIIGWWAGTTFLMPVDSIMLLAYSAGYTEFKDPLKAGIVPTLGLIALSSTLTPFIVTTFNIGAPLLV